MATYATAAEFRTYADFTGGVDADIEKVIVQAERDIDSIVGGWFPEANGLKFGSPASTNEKSLTTYQRAKLRDAVCAQTEYRILMGPDHFAAPEYTRVSGPDFSTEPGTAPKIGPKTWRELRGTGLVLAPLLVI